MNNTLFIFMFIWITFGFIAFVVECRKEKYKTINSYLKIEFLLCLTFGLIALVAVTEPFTWCLAKLLSIINRK